MSVWVPLPRTLRSDMVPTYAPSYPNYSRTNRFSHPGMRGFAGYAPEPAFMMLPPQMQAPYGSSAQMFQMPAHVHPEREQRRDIPRLSMVPTNVKSLQREVESLKEEIRRMRNENATRAEEKGLAQELDGLKAELKAMRAETASMMGMPAFCSCCGKSVVGAGIYCVHCGSPVGHLPVDDLAAPDLVNKRQFQVPARYPPVPPQVPQMGLYPNQGMPMHYGQPQQAWQQQQQQQQQEQQQQQQQQQQMTPLEWANYTAQSQRNSGMLVPGDPGYGAMPGAPMQQQQQQQQQQFTPDPLNPSWMNQNMISQRPTADRMKQQHPPGTNGPPGPAGEMGIEEQRDGEMALSVKPYKAVLTAFQKAGGYDRQVPPEAPNDAPKCSLELEHVYGFRKFDRTADKGFVGYTSKGGALFGAAGVGVVQFGTGQDHLIHKRNKKAVQVTCMALNSDGTMAAMGERGACVVSVWKVDKDPEMMTAVKGKHDKGMVAVCFSADSKRVASIGDDDDHTLTVFELEKGTFLYKKTTHNVLCDIAWSPYDPKEFSIVIVGSNTVEFWNVAGKEPKLKKKGQVPAGKKNTVAVAFIKTTDADPDAAKHDGGYAVTGMEDGRLLLWKEGQVLGKDPKDPKEGLSKHTKAVLALHSLHDEGLLLSGSTDGMVLIWDSTKFGKEGPLASILLSDTLSTFRLEPRAIGVTCVAMTKPAITKKGSGPSVLVGSTGGEVIEVELTPDWKKDGGGPNPLNAIQDVREVSMGHKNLSFMPTGGAEVKAEKKGQLWGLCAHPTKDWFATCGDDGDVRLWDMNSRKCIHSRPLLDSKAQQAGARSLAFRGPDGKQLAVGLRTGEVVLVDVSDDGRMPDSAPLPDRAVDRKKEVTAVQYTPAGRRLAVANSMPAVIDIYDCSSDPYLRLLSLKGHTAAVLHIDWDESGGWLQSVCKSDSLLFWKIPDPPPAGDIAHCTDYKALAEVAWATVTCPFAWSAIACLTKAGNAPKSVDRSANRTLLVSGDDNHMVNLFDYPAIENSQPRAYGAHSSQVTQVCMSSSGDRVISVGGEDLSVMQWHVDNIN